MNNFLFHSPTAFVFGKNTEYETGSYVKKYGGKKVMIHYGGGSVITSGLMDRIEKSLQENDIAYIKLGGVQPNPVDTLVYEGIEICKKENVDFILAVGGGSTIDSAKAIAAGSTYDGDFWDFYSKKAECKTALKIGTVLTIPAAGSEGSPVSVITKTNEGLKRSMRGDFLRPVFSIMNPEITYTLPPFQTACGIADMMAHLMERYFSHTVGVEITDGMCESILKTIIQQGNIVMTDPTNYDGRANLMWAGMLAHNGICGVGREEDWSSHALGHEVSTLYNVAHGASLSIIFPAWMKYVYQENIPQFTQFAEKVWGIQENDPTIAAYKGIEALEQFFISLGLPVRLQDIGAEEKDFDRMVNNLFVLKENPIGNFKKISNQEAYDIYQLATQM